MFREMRRKNQQLAYDEAVAVLENGKTGVLAVLGDEGYPYTVPVNYVYKNGKIYLHCAKAGHKLDAIRACNKVSFCVIEQDEVLPEKLATRYRSAIAFCSARICEADEEIYDAAKALGLKYYNNSYAVEKEITREWAALACIELSIEHLTGKESLDLMKKEIQLRRYSYET